MAIDPDGFSHRRASGLYVPDTPLQAVRFGPVGREKYGDQPIGIDLFCGCGGFSLGFIQAGFRVVAALDWDADAVMTYMHNLGAYPCQFHFVTVEDEQRMEKALTKENKRGEIARSGSNRQPEWGAWRRAYVDGRCPRSTDGQVAG